MAATGLWWTGSAMCSAALPSTLNLSTDSPPLINYCFA